MHSILNMLGYAYSKSGNFSKGEHYFRQSVCKNPCFPYPRYNLGMIYLKQNKYKKAAEAFSAALKQDGDFPEARFNLGVILAKQAKFKEAKQVFATDIKAFSDFLIPPLKKQKNEEYGSVKNIQKDHAREWKDFITNIRLTRQFVQYEKCLKQAAAEDKDIRKAWHDFGVSAYEQKKFLKAEKIFKKTVSLEKKYIDMLQGSGIKSLIGKDYSQAVEAYLSLADLINNYKKAGLMLGLLMSEQERFEEAEAILAEIAEIDIMDRETLDALAKSLARQDKLSLAAETYRRLIDVAGEDTGILFDYAIVLMRQDKYRQASHLLNTAVKKDNNFLFGWLKLGDCYQFMEQHVLAESAFMRVIYINKNHQEAIKKLCLCLYKQDKYIQVIEWLEKLPAQDFSHDLLQMQGNCNYMLGYFRKSEQIFSRLLESSKNADYLYKLGKSLAGQKKYEAAEKAFLDLIQIEKDNEQALFELGLIYDRLQKYSKAKDVLEKVTKLNPKDKQAWYYLGIVYGDLKMYEQAIKSFDMALALDKDYKEAWNNKGVCVFKLKDYNTAEKYFRKAVEADQNYHEAWYNLGISLSRLNRTKESEEALEKSRVKGI